MSISYLCEWNWAEFDLNNPLHELMAASAFAGVLLIVITVLYFLKEREAKNLEKSAVELEAKVEELLGKIEEYEKHEKDINEAMGGLDYRDYRLVPIQIVKDIHADENVYQYFVDMDAKAEFILNKARADITEEIMNKLLKEDLIIWDNLYDPRWMRYKVEGRLVLAVYRSKLDKLKKEA